MLHVCYWIVSFENKEKRIINDIGDWNTSFQPPHDKTNKMICAPSEDSYQPQSDQSLHCALSGNFLHTDSEEFSMGAHATLMDLS